MSNCSIVVESNRGRRPLSVLYLFRKRGAGYSIEGLFTQLITYFGKRSVIKIRQAYAPRMELSLSCLYANFRFAAHQPAADIYHITGDIHYIMLSLPPERTVLTIHDCVSLVRQQLAGNELKFRMLWFLFYYLPMRRAKYITTVSEKSKQELLYFMGASLADKVVVIPNHHNPCFVAQPKAFNAIKPTLLQIGTAAHKNLSRLLDAIAPLACRLIIIGGLTHEQQRQLDEAAIDYQQKERLSEAEMLAEYVACDLVTFVSTYEGFGMPILEANAVGRPVLTADISPLREVAGQAACLVDPLSVDSIRAGLIHILTDSAYRDQLVEAGYRNAAQYTVARIAEKYEALYEQILHP